jgi:hypothetical protein
VVACIEPVGTAQEVIACKGNSEEESRGEVREIAYRIALFCE